MQDRYVSLDPAFATTKQAFTDREILYNQRYLEAQGGPYARSVGILAALTTSSYFYVRAQRSGFTGVFPLARHNAGHLTLILGAGFVAYNFAASLVNSVTGDTATQGYLLRKKYAIISGQAPLERSEQ